MPKRKRSDLDDQDPCIESMNTSWWSRLLEFFCPASWVRRPEANKEGDDVTEAHPGPTNPCSDAPNEQGALGPQDARTTEAHDEIQPSALESGPDACAKEQRSKQDDDSTSDAQSGMACSDKPKEKASGQRDVSHESHPSSPNDSVLVIDDSDDKVPRLSTTDARAKYLASRPLKSQRVSRFRPMYAMPVLSPAAASTPRVKGPGPAPRRALSSLSQRRKAPLGMVEFRAQLQARQQARIAAMVRDAFHTLRGARTGASWEDFQALVRKRAHVQQLLDLETLRVQPRAHVLDEAEYTKRTLAALQEREEHARARLPERARPAEKQRETVREAKARRRAAHGVLGRATLPTALPAAAEARVQQALAQRGIVSTMKGAQVEAHDMAKLRPGQWLNDEVINFYGQLIQQRANEAAPQPGVAGACWAVHVFSSFFWENLTTRGYAGVRRWSRRVDLFTKDLVLLPINVGQAHWVCAAIDLRLRRFAYYDSMGMPSPVVLQRLRAYLSDELRDKHGLTLYLDDWADYFACDTSPQQSNGYDCGVFTAQTLEQLSRRDPALPYPAPLEAAAFAQPADPRALELLREEYSEDYAWNFDQSDMPYLRRRMVYEIATKQLLTE
ncbi:Ulp1 peptidase [Malassezia nana]|uniref:Ulp1 peptidase n=1 Tax=Malassezia nana TaxID=180528 RepID=A0AAF0EQ28_9BASI|nr:Ulp1 peptidase [Malassezia nana]